MPYIQKEDRSKFDEVLSNLPMMKTKGELEYCIFKLMRQYQFFHGSRYAELHDCTYAAQHCADEFRRRFLDTREDVARQTNGDI